MNWGDAMKGIGGITGIKKDRRKRAVRRNREFRNSRKVRQKGSFGIKRTYGYENRCPYRKRKPIKNCFILLLLILLVSALYFTADRLLEPVLNEIAEVRAKELMAQSINSSVIEVMEAMRDIEEDKNGFLSFSSDENGYISAVSANTVYMNEFSARMTERIHENISKTEGEKVRISLGAITGSNLLSQVGPKLDLKIEPIGSAEISFITEFDEGGINQTKYKVYMEVSGKVKPVIPFVKEEYEINTVVPVAETVIVGRVPETYMSLPLTEN